LLHSTEQLVACATNIWLAPLAAAVQLPSAEFAGMATMQSRGFTTGAALKVPLAHVSVSDPEPGASSYMLVSMVRVQVLASQPFNTAFGVHVPAEVF
jgi:hypothetical protein